MESFKIARRINDGNGKKHSMEKGLSDEKVIVIDFGGQYNQLVARRVRECNVYCEIYSYKTGIEQIKAMAPKGIILTGGPNSCYEENAPTYTKELFELGIPVLGLCYGAQLMTLVLGGKVEKAPVREYGKTQVYVDTATPLFADVEQTTICWMSHFDYYFCDCTWFSCDSAHGRLSCSGGGVF